MQRLIEGFRPDDGREVVRVVAGVLIAVGLLLVAIRKGTPDIFGETTSAFGLFVILGAAAAFLYGMGILGRTLGGASRRWQALYTVAGMLIAPVALLQLIEAIDSTPNESFASLLVFTICAGGCVFAWLVAAVRYQLLLGAIYSAFAWLSLLDIVLGDGVSDDLDTVRALLLVFAVGLVAAAFAVRKRAVDDPYGAFSELLTGAGLAAFIAFLLGPYVAIVALAIPFGGVSSEIGGQSAIWDLLTLLTGTGLVLFGLGRGLRGPAYVGTVMLALFLFSVGLDLDDSSPEGKLVGWPLLLCIVGAALFVLSLLPGRELPLVGAIGGWFEGGGTGARPPEAAPPTGRVAERVEPPVDEPPTEPLGGPPPPRE